MQKYFNDKVIWITGASSGIGEAIARYLITNTSAKLVLSARNENKLSEIASQCSSNRILILPFDLSNFDAEELTKKVIQTFGRIDILINNGGMSQRSKVLETTEEIERQLFEINYFAHTKLTRSVLPFMLQQNFGHIVVVSSIAGKFGFYLRSTYSAAKHALYGYFESLRLEYEKQGIKVTIVSPGKVKTNISLNAIGPQGHQHNRMDESHQNAMSAEEAAIKILKGIASQKEEILVGKTELLTVYLKRFFPKIFNWIIRRQSPY